MSMWLIVVLCVVYVVGWVSASRWIIVEHGPQDRAADFEELVVAGFAGMLWPPVAAAAIVCAPFAGIGWIASRGVRRLL